MQNARISKQRFVIMVCLTAVLFLSSIPSIGAKAAGYSGSGTMADPYLVQTAEQLQGMRDDLTAHYKLANTIDLSGMDFKPVGRLESPFQGTFVCELNEDLTPKYIIKNLSVSVKETKYSAENKNRWEAALFGATNGATISGIYILDAKISNQNHGGNQGSVAWGNYVPGQDEKNSAILIGDAESTTISNCGTTGVVDTRANHCGGLVGFSKNSTIMNCYSTATVTSEGYWNIGGLIGTTEDTMIANCFATGNVTGAQSNIGSFIGGAVNTTVADCYATGNASGGRERKNAFVVVSDGATATFENCYALGKVDKAVQIVDNPITTKNCWVLNGKLHNTEQFSEGSRAQIQSAFQGLANWNTKGKEPKLTTMGVVTEASKYQVNAVADTPSVQNDSVANDEADSEGTGNVEQTASKEAVVQMIEALPNPEEEGAITIEHKDAVKEAWKAYEALSAGAKDEFDVKLAGKLASARYQMSVLVAGGLVTALETLPKLEDITSEKKDMILELWDDYQFLDDTVAAELDQEWIDKLEEAYEYVQQGGMQNTFVEIDTELTSTEKAIVIACGVVILLALTFDILAGVWLIRRIQKLKKQHGVNKKAEQGHDQCENQE